MVYATKWTDTVPIGKPVNRSISPSALSGIDSREQCALPLPSRRSAHHSRRSVNGTEFWRRHVTAMALRCLGPAVDFDLCCRALALDVESTLRYVSRLFFPSLSETFRRPS